MFRDIPYDRQMLHRPDELHIASQRRIVENILLQGFVKTIFAQGCCRRGLLPGTGGISTGEILHEPAHRYDSSVITRTGNGFSGRALFRS